MNNLEASVTVWTAFDVWYNPVSGRLPCTLSLVENVATCELGGIKMTGFCALGQVAGWS